MLPDAPWIRDAETNGYTDGPEIPDPVCPYCGYENPDQFFVMDGTVLGCDHCIDMVDTHDWAVDQWEQDMEVAMDDAEELKGCGAD